MNATFFVVFLLFIGTMTYARRANRTRSFYHLLRVSLLISLVKENEFNKLFTILERERTVKGRFLHSDLCQRSKLKGDEIHPTPKVFDVVLTDDHGADAVRNIGRLKNKIFGECMGRWSKCGVVQLLVKIFIEIVEK